MEANHLNLAGGHPRIRLTELNIVLPPAKYNIHFDNSVSPYTHHPGNWDAFPPDNLFWGIEVRDIEK